MMPSAGSDVWAMKSRAESRGGQRAEERRAKSKHHACVRANAGQKKSRLPGGSGLFGLVG